MVVRSMIGLTLLMVMSACERRVTDAPPPAKSGQLPMAPPGATGARAAGLMPEDPEPMPGLGPVPDGDEQEPPLPPMAPDAGGGGVEL